MRPDLHALRRELLLGHRDASTELEHAIERARSPEGRAAFVRPMFDEARAQIAVGQAHTALMGLPISVKDLFDIQGQVTTAGSVVLADEAPAAVDAAAVARLRAAGGTILGRTHMVEFAFSGVGVNPHAQTPAAWDALVDAPVGAPGRPRVPGGSSSGAAVSVATGAAFIGLGTDTGGSIRIPAALNGIVGFKSTARRVPTSGAWPLSTTLDTVCAMTLSVRDAILAHEILADRSVVRASAPLSAYRLAVAGGAMLQGMDAEVAHSFERALQRLRQAGAVIDDIDLAEIDELAGIQAAGGFAVAESHAAHRLRLERDGERYDPRVAARMRRGASMQSHHYLDLIAARNAWIERLEHRLRGFDAMLSPTVPIVAPELSDVAPGVERDDTFFRINGLLLRNPGVVNMFDGCALSLPCHEPGSLPVGLMIWHGGLRDDLVLAIAEQIEARLRAAIQ